MGLIRAFNFALVVLLMLPSVLLYYFFLQRCGQEGAEGKICEWGRENPFRLMNLMYFLNVDVLFWIICVLQGSFELADPFWAVVPVLIAHFFAAHPSSKYDSSRSTAVCSLIWFWTARMTRTYCRKEDRPYEDLREQNDWQWLSLVLVFFYQHLVPIAATLPLYSVHISAEPWNKWDVIGTVLCIFGVIVAYIADTELCKFEKRNRVLMDKGEPQILLLDRGIWHYSRHPDYFGEYLFWWGLSMFASSVGHAVAGYGIVVYSFFLWHVMKAVERQILEDPSRAEIYREYQQTTSPLTPWFKSEGRPKVG